MWKALVGFLVFAAIALFFIFKAGDKMDMQGEAGAHSGAASEHASAPAASAASVATSTVEAAATASSSASAVEVTPAASSAASVVSK